MVRHHHVPLRVDGLTIWLDTFLDRMAPPPGGALGAEVDEADYIFISHCHFDHILGANIVAMNTGANVVGSYEAMRLMNEAKVPLAQQWPVSGGEVVDCGHGVTVTVYPGMHSCLFAANDPDSGGCCVGDLGVSLQAEAGHHGSALRPHARSERHGRPSSTSTWSTRSAPSRTTTAASSSI
jgi:L-ascorbate metabolism protein UlaG (beta-lactamase superfamily)